MARLIDEFLSRHVQVKLKEDTAEQYTYRLKAYVEPEIGDLLACEVTKRDIIALGDEIAEDGKRDKQTSGRGSKGGYREGGVVRMASLCALPIASS